MDDRFSLEDRHVDLVALLFLLPVSHIPGVVHGDIYAAPIMLLETGMWCLEMQLEECPRGAVGGQACHSRMLGTLLDLFGPFL